MTKRNLIVLVKAPPIHYYDFNCGGYRLRDHSKYWMHIHYDTIEDGQDKQSHVLFLEQIYFFKFKNYVSNKKQTHTHTHKTKQNKTKTKKQNKTKENRYTSVEYKLACHSCSISHFFTNEDVCVHLV